MSALQRLRDAAKALMGYPKPKGSGVMPGHPDWLIGQPWSLKAVEMDVPNAIAKVGTIYACIARVAEDFARLPRVFEREVAPGEYEAVEREPDTVADIFANANSEQSSYELLRDLGAHYKSAGNAFMVVDTFGVRRPSSRAWELWSAQPHLMEVVMGERRKPVGYVFDRGGVRQRIEAEHVVHFRGFNPKDEPRGTSPLETVEFQYGNRYNLPRIIDAFLRSGGVLPGYWYVPESADAATAQMALTPKAQDDLLEVLKSRQGVGAWFKPMLSGMMQRKDAGVSFKDMLFVEILASQDADICRALGVPPWMVGIKENASALSGQQGPATDVAVYWNNTVQPMADLFDAVMTERFCPRFEEKLRVRTDFSGVIPMQMERLAQADKVKSVAGRAVITVNEGRKLLGLEPVDDPEADDLYVQASPFGGGAVSGGEAPTDSPAPPEEKKPEQKSRMIDGDESRETRRRRHAVRLAQYERAFARAFNERVFGPQEKRVVAALVNGDRSRVEFGPQEKRVVAALVNGDRSRVEIAQRTLAIDAAMLSDPDDEEAIRRIFEDMVRARGEEALAQIASEVDMLVQGGRASQWIKDRTSKLLANTGSTTTEALRLSLAEGAANGEAIGDLIARVREVFDDRRANAVTIARTEMGGAYNFAAVEAWSQSGEVESLEWLSARDGAVRETHADADGQTVPMGGSFMVGGFALAYPGDTSGPAEEVINCRCVAEPVLTERSRRARWARWWQSVGTNGHVPANRVRGLVDVG